MYLDQKKHDFPKKVMEFTIPTNSTLNGIITEYNMYLPCLVSCQICLKTLLFRLKGNN